MRSTPRSWALVRALFAGRRRLPSPAPRRGRRGVTLPEGLEARRMLATIQWDGGPTGDGTLFRDPVNWVGDVLPGPADTALIGPTGSSPTISLIGATSAARIETSRVISLGNAFVTNSVITTTGAGKLLATGSGASLTAVTLAGELDLSTGHVRVYGGLTLDNAVIRLGGATGTTYGTFYFEGGSQSLAGTGDIVFVGGHPLNSIRTYGSSTTQALSIGPGITIRGAQGTIEGSTTKPIRVVNEGAIVAEGPGTIGISPIAFENRGAIVAKGGGIALGGSWTNATAGSITATGNTLSLGSGTGAWTNLGTIAATDSTVNLGGTFATGALGAFARTGGTVNLTGSLDNASTTLRLDDTTGSWNLVGGSITGGRYEAKGSARLVPTATAGRLSGVTLGSDLDMTGGSVNVSGGLVLDGATVRMGGRTGGAGTITFDGGTQAIGGSGTFLFGAGKGRLLARGSDISQTLTIGAGITLRGNAGSIEGLASAPIRVVNMGVIAADARTPDPADLGYDQSTAGGAGGGFTDAVDLSAVADPLPGSAYLNYRSNQTLAYAFDGLAAGVEHRVRLHFVEHVAYLSPRRMNVALNGVVVHAGLDVRAEAGALFKAIAREYPVVADADGRVGVILEGTSWNAIVSAIEVYSGAVRVASSDSGGAATGTIAIDAVAFENRGVLSARAAETLRLAGGWTNLGTVTAAAGGRVSLAPATGANLATITAALGGTLNLEGSFPTSSIPAYEVAGGTVTLTGAIDNAAATLRLDDTTGSLRILGGSIAGGRYQAMGSARLVATGGGGRLAGLTLAGDLDVTSGAISVSGGLSLDQATVRVGGRSPSAIGAVTFDGGTQKIDGSGQVIFGESAANRMHVLGTASTQTLTIDAGITIRGNGGTIEGKSSAPIRLVNKGTVVADAATPFASDLGYDQSAAGGSTGSFTDPVDRSAVVVPLPESAYRNYRRDTGAATWLPGTGLTYTFPGLVPAAVHRVRLHFVEHEHASDGKRLATISLNGTTVQAGLDVHAEAGGRFKAIVREYPATADADGTIVVSLRGSVAGHVAVVSAIEVFSGDTRVASSDCGGDLPRLLVIQPQGFANEGTLAATGGGSLQVSSVSVAAWSNPGTIAVDRGVLDAGNLIATAGTVTVSRGELRVKGDYVQTAGSTTLVEGILDPSGAATISGGALVGSGTVKANLANAGSIDVGGSGAAGTLAVEGAFTQAATGSLRVEIGRPANDLLRVTGAATLGGAFEVGVIDAGSLPMARTTYDVLRYASVSGAFGAVSGLVDVAGRGLSMESAADRLSIVSEARDPIPPTLAITADMAALRAGDAAVLTFTLSEAVTGFTADDVAVTGGTLSGFTGSGSPFSAVFTPSADLEGEGTVRVAEGAFADLFGNANVAGASLTFPIDTRRPTVTITPSRTDIRTAETATIAFALSDGTVDFTPADVTVTGGTLSGFSGSGRTYSALFTPTAGFTGSGSVGVAAGAFADAAGNASLAGASPALSIDTLAPTVKITSSVATLRSGTTAKITFTLSKGSTTFALADVVAAGGSLSAFAGTGTSYSATFTPQPGFNGPGTVTVAADAFTDSTGRGNAGGSLSPAIVVDTVAPSVTIASDKAKLKAGETATLTFTLSEESSTFTGTDVTVAGGTLSAFSGTGAVYTATFTPAAASTRSGTVSVAAGRFTDKAGNLSTAGALTPAITIDTLLPRATITASPTSLLFGKTSKITFTLSEASADFTLDDVSATGGTLSGFTVVSPTSSWATFTPAASSTADGTVSVAAGRFGDAAGNGNAASGLATAITINTVQPTVAITSDRATLKAGEKATITFRLSESSTDFIATDVRATGGVLSLFSGSGTDYSVTFTPAANFTGLGTVTVAAGTFKNAATNPNVAAALAPALVVDTLPPTLRLTSDKTALKAGETATITFTASEPIALDLANVTVGGGTLSDLSGAGAVYKATFTPNASSTASGTVTVAAGRIADLAGNPSTAGATLPAIKVDTLLPTVKVACAPTALKAGVVSKVTFSLSETSTSFDASDVSVTGGTLSSFTAVSGSSYWATFTPTAGFEGVGTVDVAAGSFRDAAGNGNLAGALAAPLRIDTLAPTVLVKADVDSLTSLKATAIRFTLSEPSSTFTASKVAVLNGTLSDFTGSGTSYSATFKPKLDFTGTATISVPAGRFFDAAGNGNPASPVLELAITAARVGFQVAADRASAVYACGEPARITVTLEENGVPVNGNEVVVRLSRDHLADEGEMRLTVVDGRAEFVRTLAAPGFLNVTADIGVFARTTVAFSPERILPATGEPADFDAFWEAGRRQLAAIPFDPVVTALPSASRVADAYKISLANIDGTRVWGFLSVPKAPAGPMPLLVSVPGASFRAPAGPGYDWVDRGVMRLWISVHPHDPQLPKAELDALEQSPAGQYPRLGAPDPGQYYFRRAILGADRLVDWVCANFAWDGAHCVAQGHSQGGAFALFLAGFNRRVTACATEAPAMCDHAGYTIGRSPGWPQLASGQDATLQDATLAMSGYYEGAFFARRIAVPTLFTIGFHDFVCPPSSGYAAYNQISAPKRMIHQLDRGHLMGHPYYETVRDYEWLPEALGLIAATATGGATVAAITAGPDPRRLVGEVVDPSVASGGGSDIAPPAARPVSRPAAAVAVDGVDASALVSAVQTGTVSVVTVAPVTTARRRWSAREAASARLATPHGCWYHPAEGVEDPRAGGGDA